MDVHVDVPMHRYTSFGVGGTVTLLCTPHAPDVAEAVYFAHRLGKPMLVLGAGTNVLFSDRGFDGVVIRLRVSDGQAIWGSGYHQNRSSVVVRAPAAVLWDDVVAYGVRNGLQGVECLSGIPGTAGAAPVQNIGAYGQQVTEVIRWVRAVDLTTGRPTVFDRGMCGFGYRTSVFNRSDVVGRYCITDICLELRVGAVACTTHRDVAALVEPLASLRDVRRAVLQVRKRKGMLSGQLQSAGSFFKNPTLDVSIFERTFKERDIVDGEDVWWRPADGGIRVSAAWLIESSGFRKGMACGRVGLSPHHVLSLINRGDATAADIVGLARDIQVGVQSKFGILLEPEVQLIGFEAHPLIAR